MTDKEIEAMKKRLEKLENYIYNIQKYLIENDFRGEDNEN